MSQFDHVDPYTLDEIPLDDPQDHLRPGWGEREIRKRYNDLFEGFEELERQIESGDVPECCAGYWALFGCHRPRCLNENLIDPTCSECGDPLTEYEKALPLNPNGLCEGCYISAKLQQVENEVAG